MAYCPICGGILISLSDSHNLCVDCDVVWMSDDDEIFAVKVEANALGELTYEICLNENNLTDKIVLRGTYMECLNFIALAQGGN